MKTVYCIGELLIDFICKEQGVSLAEATSFEKKAGGAPANVAAAITKLGGNAAFLGQVGNDAFGEYLYEVLRAEAIQTDLLTRAGQTTLAFVSIDADGERSFQFNRGGDGEYTLTPEQLATIATDGIVHFGSATAFLPGNLRETYFELAQVATTNQQFISFDPNYRDALMNTPEREAQFIQDSQAFLALADFVKVSDEEAMLITGTTELAQAVEQLHALGAKVVTVTLGKAGTLLSMNGQQTTIGSITINQVDSTGAGDAFVGGVLSQLSHFANPKQVTFEQWQQVIQFANIVGALTCTNYGAMAAMPTQA
ncbi:MAG: carbohydrate kinase family protein, partial [Culicoidibacterales bacterium]